MRVCILGGDGYLGWPTAMYLANQGHDVSLIDNLAKRAWEAKCGVRPLKPLPSLFERVKRVESARGDDRAQAAACRRRRHRERLSGAGRRVRSGPTRSSTTPSSGPRRTRCRPDAVYTQQNNVVGNLNVLYAMPRRPDIHLVKLGTMGEYGTPNIDIEEGWLDVEHNGRTDRVLFPKRPGSFYHLSKVHDSHNIEFACRIWGLRATDLNQGVVYGIETEQTALDARLATRSTTTPCSAPCSTASSSRR